MCSLKVRKFALTEVWTGTKPLCSFSGDTCAWNIKKKYIIDHPKKKRN